MISHRIAVSASLTALPLLLGCADGTSREADVTVIDSAGVRIVEHRAIPTAIPTWRVSDSAFLDLGVIQGEGPELFGRIANVTILADSIIVVADALSHSLKAFDLSGRHLWTTGREGNGPGEFANLSGAFAIEGDSLLAVSDGSVSVLDRSGLYRRQFRLAIQPNGFAGPIVVGAAQNMLFGYGVNVPTFEPGPYRTNLSLNIYDSTGRRLGHVVDLPHSESVLRMLSGDTYTSRAAPLGRKTQFGIARTGLGVGTQERFEIFRYDAAGRLQTIVRVLKGSQPISAEIRRRFEAFSLENANDADQRRRLAEFFRGDVYPESLPAFGAILYDPEGRLWVQQYVLPYKENSPIWWVFSGDGAEVLESVTMPRGFELRHIEADYVLGLHIDELGVSHVQARRLSKSIAGS